MAGTLSSAAKPVRTSAAAKTIGKYTDVKVIARGGMGAVYLAMHPTLKREVIIKKLLLRRGGGGDVKKRFEREAQILIDLTSTNVVRMFDYFSEKGADYIVLEYVDGMSLDKLLEKQYSLPVPLALTIFLNACRGLKAAHDRGIIHRDIKPANILISRKAEVKLADFGIAGNEKEEDEPDGGTVAAPQLPRAGGMETMKTQVGAVLGTPAYMSPEQLEDSSSVDKRTDIYSMGVMLYQMVTGDRPYKGDMTEETVGKIKRGKYIPPRRIDSSLPPFVCRLIKKMMRPNKNRRYRSIDLVIRKVRTYLSSYYSKQTRHDILGWLARTVRTDKYTKLPPFEQRYRGMRALVAGVLIAALLAVAWFTGAFYRTILRPFFVPVALNLEVPADIKSESGHYAADLPVKAFFFENKEGIPEVKGANGSAVFKLAKTQASEDTMLLTAKTVYLRPGDYRIKLVGGPYVWWRSLSVAEGEPLTLDLDFLKDERRRLSIHGFAADYDTGEDITSRTEFQMQVGGRWTALKDVKPVSLASGKIFRIRAVCKGYEPEEFGLSIEWYQDSLFVSASLHKAEE